jgi:trans-aconitate methyltransferase
MGDQWFEVAEANHFWIHRRSDVMQRLAGDAVCRARRLGEIGCGHGLVQRQIEQQYDRPVTGIDLNDYALRHNLSERSPLYCYDILQRGPELEKSFDILFLFDVLEHLEDEDRFLQAVQFHLAPGGKILINVPAFQSFFSSYDVAAGHFRRYSIATLRRVAERNRMTLAAWTYWGMPLIPLLLLRKLWMLGNPHNNTISRGFKPPSAAMNNLLYAISSCEVISQRIIGTSLMAVLEMEH